MQIQGRMRRSCFLTMRFSISLSARSTVSSPGTSRDGAGENMAFQSTILADDMEGAACRKFGEVSVRVVDLLRGLGPES